MKKDPLAIFRTLSTGVILNYVDKHQHTQYEDFLKFCTPYALNRILRELQNRGFITCFYNVETGDNRIELTEKGKGVLEILRELAEILKDDSPGTENGAGEQKKVTPYALYEQVYENPLMPCKDIAEKTGIPLKKVFQDLKDMYEKCVLRGPVLSVKPARNYHEYAHLLMVEDPLTFCHILKKKHILHLRVSFGKWNVLAITDTTDFSSLPRVRECILVGVKSAVYNSKVVVVDFEESVRRIQDAIPEGKMKKEKTTLYEEIPANPWDEEEWRLYYAFRKNARCNIAVKLKEFKISPTKYRDWVSTLDQFVVMRLPYYPGGLRKYSIVDIVFNSHYHRQIAGILGLLPSTSLCFSVKDYLFVRLFLLDTEETDVVFSLIDQMESYYSTYSAALECLRW